MFRAPSMRHPKVPRAAKRIGLGIRCIVILGLPHDHATRWRGSASASSEHGTIDTMSTSAEAMAERLAALRVEIRALATQATPRTTSAEFTSWHARTRTALSKALGVDHHITDEFVKLGWQATARISVPGRPAQDWDTGPFRNAARKAEGYLDAAIAELDIRTDGGRIFDAVGVDPDLWDFLQADIEGEHWGRAATQAMLFVEDRIRRWSGQPDGLVGEGLMTAVFGEHGNHRLGRTPGEQQGWHRLAMGMSMALRNVVAHRIQDRDDHRRYTLGVIGVGSLLLTQLRYEHGNRFHQTDDPDSASDVAAAEPTT